MKILFFAFLLSLTSAYVVQVTEQWARLLEFDSQLNSYVVGDTDMFFKVNKNNTVVQTEKFFWILQILVNKNDDVFIINGADNNGYDATVSSVYRLKPDSVKSEFLFNYSMSFVGEISYHYKRMNYFMDEDDNIFFNTFEGVSLFRSRKNTPMPIAINNLEDYFFETSAVDEAGNVYLSSSTYRSNSIAIIPNSAKKKFVPDAIFHLVSENSIITNFKLWNGDLILADQNKLWRLKKELTGSLDNELILYQYNTSYTIFDDHSDRLFVYSNDRTSKICRFQFLTSGDEFVSMEDEAFCWEVNNPYNAHTFSKDGTGYFISTELNSRSCNNSYGYLLWIINHNETKFVDNQYCFPSGSLIRKMNADDHGNVYILAAGRLFAIPKGSITPILVYESPFWAYEENYIKFKKETNEIFLVLAEGLFVLSNDLNNYSGGQIQYIKK